MGEAQRDSQTERIQYYAMKRKRMSLIRWTEKFREKEFGLFLRQKGLKEGRIIRMLEQMKALPFTEKRRKMAAREEAFHKQPECKKRVLPQPVQEAPVPIFDAFCTYCGFNGCFERKFHC